MLDIQCPFCNATAGQPCVTATGNPARKTHAARTQTTEENAQMTIEYDYHAEAREEEGHVVAHLTEHPEQTFDPNALMVAPTLDGGWEVFGPHCGTHRVSADFQTVTHAGREVSTEYREHNHAIPAAKAGAKAIQEHNRTQATGEERQEKAVETAAYFAEAHPNDVETVLASLANELGTDVDGARKALAEHFQPGSTTGEETTGGDCQWFRDCPNEATTTRRGPVLSSSTGWGEIPTCESCAFLVDESDKRPKHDSFTYHVIFDADSVDNDDALPAAQEGRWLLPKVRTHRHNSYNEVRSLLRNIYGAKNPRPVALMRLQDGQSLGWNDQGLATAHA